MRVRVVFLKQCFAWMIHGHLEDPSHEFFIQVSHNNHSSSSVNYDKNTSSFLSSSPQQQQYDDDKKNNKNIHDDLLLQDIILQKLYQAKINTNHHHRPHSLSSSSSSSSSLSSSSFDWINSYQLRLDYIPSSHISPRIATKIMFSGKAIKLLQQQSISISTPNNYSSGSSSTYNENVFGLNNDAYKYLSKSNDKLHIDYQQHKQQQQQQQQQQHNKKKIRSKSQNNDGNDDGDNNHDENESDISSGFSNSDIIKYTNRFTEILNATSSSSSSSSSSSAIELLETVVNDIHDSISNRLWVLLRDKYGFYSFLHVIRNTYLLGN